MCEEYMRSSDADHNFILCRLLLAIFVVKQISSVISPNLPLSVFKDWLLNEPSLIFLWVDDLCVQKLSVFKSIKGIRSVGS